MDKIKHLPRPWTCSQEVLYGPAVIRDANGAYVCETVNKKEAEAIVDAVNGHQELVKQLQLCGRDLRIAHGMLKGEIRKRADEISCLGDRVERANEVLAKVGV